MQCFGGCEQTGPECKLKLAKHPPDLDDHEDGGPTTQLPAAGYRCTRHYHNATMSRAVGLRGIQAVTHDVMLAGDASSIDNSPRLQPGSQFRCPHCRRWHDVIAVNTEGTAHTVAMRY